MSDWLPIPGYPDYEVSRDGAVRSWRPWRGQPGPRVLRQYPDNDGYPWVVVACGSLGSRRRLRVHKLVATLFIGPRPEGLEVRHLDGDNTNNSVGNLAWGTSTENAQDRIRHGTWAHGERARAKLTEASVLEIRRLLGEGQTQKALAQRFGVGRGAIAGIARGKTWQHLAAGPVAGRNPPNAEKTHCVHGHEYTAGNTAIHKGRRECRTCQRERHVKAAA